MWLNLAAVGVLLTSFSYDSSTVSDLLWVMLYMCMQGCNSEQKLHAVLNKRACFGEWPRMTSSGELKDAGTHRDYGYAG